MRPALATGALETARRCMRCAVGVCGVGAVECHAGAHSRAGGRLWRRRWSGTGKRSISLTRTRRRAWRLRRLRHWDVHGGPDVATWLYRCELAGPSSTAWRTRSAGAVLHLRWLVDPARPWAGVSPLTARGRYRQFKRLVRQAPIRRGERAGRIVSAGREVRRRPRRRPGRRRRRRPARPAQAGHRRRARVKRWRSKARWRRRIVRPVHPRKDFQVAAIRRESATRSCGAASEQVTRDIGSACGIPRALLDSTASGKRRANLAGLSRRRLTVSVVGSKRRSSTQLGVAVSFDSSPLGGRDLLARAAVFRRLKEGRSDHCRRATDAAGI